MLSDGKSWVPFFFPENKDIEGLKKSLPELFNLTHSEHSAFYSHFILTVQVIVTHKGHVIA